MHKLYKLLAMAGMAFCTLGATSCLGDDKDQNHIDPNVSPDAGNIESGHQTFLTTENVQKFLRISYKDKVSTLTSDNNYTGYSIEGTSHGYSSSFLYVGVIVSRSYSIDLMDNFGVYNKTTISDSFIVNKQGYGSFSRSEKCSFESYKDAEFVITSVTGYASKK